MANRRRIIASTRSRLKIRQFRVIIARYINYLIVIALRKRSQAAIVPSAHGNRRFESAIVPHTNIKNRRCCQTAMCDNNRQSRWSLVFEVLDHCDDCTIYFSADTEVCRKELAQNCSAEALKSQGSTICCINECSYEKYGTDCVGYCAQRRYYVYLY